MASKVSKLLAPVAKLWRPLARYISGRMQRYFTDGPAREISYQLAYDNARNLRRGLERRALEQSLDYLEANMLEVPSFPSRVDILDFALRSIRIESGLVLEFGVATGATLNQIAKTIPHEVHGFDSFEGLPESWGAEHVEGTFRQDALPSVPSNATLHQGLFEDTLPAFIAEAGQDTVRFLHVDCDLYSSTVTVLREVGDLLKPGSIIVFDEYFNFPGWQQHEYRAWQEYCDASGVSYRYLGYTERGRQVAVEITAKSGAENTPGD